VPLGPVAAAGECRSEQYLAVMPAPPGSALRTSSWGRIVLLSCVCYRSPALPLCTRIPLRVYSLGVWQPTPGVQSSPCAIWVSSSVHVMAWPLPGMPQLE